MLVVKLLKWHTRRGYENDRSSRSDDALSDLRQTPARLRKSSSAAIIHTMASVSVENCKQAAGVFAPVINRDRCEAKEDCVRVCPYNVFEIRKLSDDDRKALGLMSRLKAWAHRNRQAYAVNAADCHACGLCVAACPEHAIKLERVTA
jgi:4Fe-4S ferredoxin